MSIITFKTIGILGFGKMGSDIFNYISEFDHDIIVLCYDSEEMQRGQKAYSKKLDRRLKAGIISEDIYTAKKMSVKFTVDKEDISECDLIIECVTEDLFIKSKLLTEVDLIAKDECIIVSNSSSLIPSDIMSSKKRSGRVAGLHFFYPLALKNICEIIISKETTDQTVASIVAWLSKINRSHLLLREENAFVLNRVFMAFQAEAYNISIKRGISYKNIDDLVKKNLFPSGVFEFFDNVGIDVMCASFQNYIKMEDDTAMYIPLIEEFIRLISLGRLGVKTRSGFYDYNNETDGNETQQIETDDATRQDILKILTDRYIGSAKSIIEKGICTAETLEYAVREYMSIEKSPFYNAAENYNNLSD